MTCERPEIKLDFVRGFSPVVVAAVLAVVACKKKEQAAEAEGSKASSASVVDKRARCERLAKDAASGASLAGKLLMMGLADGTESPEEMAQARSDVDDATSKVQRELVEQCMTWPEETIECVSSPLKAFDEDCDRLVAEALGEAVAPTDVAPGPPVAWRRDLGAAPKLLRAMPTGMVIALVEREPDPADDGGHPWRELVGLEASGETWRKRLDPAPWWHELPTGELLMAERDEVLAVDPKTGNVRWRAALPADPDDPDRESRVRAVAPAGDAWIVAGSEARLFRMHPSVCATKSMACIVPLGRLTDEYFDDDLQMLTVGDTLWVREYRRLRALALSDLSIRFIAGGHEDVGWIAAHPQGLVTIVDDDVMLLDPEQCRSTEAVAPSSWPQPGRLYSRELDECEGCPPPPAGCVKWRSYVEDADSFSAPVVLDDGTVVINTDGFTMGLRDGKPAWKTPTAGSGPVVRRDDLLLVLGTGFDEGDAMTLWGLAADGGEHRWRTPLPLKIEDLLYSVDDLTVAGGGAFVVVGYEGSLAVIDLAPEP